MDLISCGLGFPVLTAVSLEPPVTRAPGNVMSLLPALGTCTHVTALSTVIHVVRKKLTVVLYIVLYSAYTQISYIDPFSHFLS